MKIAAFRSSCSQYERLPKLRLTRTWTAGPEVWLDEKSMACSNLDEVQEYDLFEIGRSHLGNPGVVVGHEARFLLQGMNLALHLRHLVV